MSNCVNLSVAGGVASVSLNRPDNMNAINNDMFESLIATAAAIESDRSVRVVVISGEGRAFCAGLDMSLFAGMLESDSAGEDSGAEKLERLTDRTHGIANRPQQAAWAWRALRVPVIASVHGAAIGGGFQVMLGSDIRFAHPDTKMSIREVNWGLIPDMSGTAIMHSLAADDVVRELTYTGRIFDAREAKEFGFVTHLSDDPQTDAMELAKTIADRSPTAVQVSKELFNRIAHADAADILMTESELQETVIGGPNQIEAVMAGLEKRAANFTD